MSLGRYRGRARYGSMLNYGTAMSLGRFAYNNRNAIASRARSMMRMGNRAYTSTLFGKKITSGAGVTSQYDRKLVYRKKTMPRYRKKRWRKFKSRVNFVSEKSLGTSTIVRNNLFQSDLGLTPTNQNIQGFVQLALYPVKNSVDFLNDVNVITGDTRLNPSSKIIFQSGVLDITMRIQSILASTSTGNPALSAEIDVYEISMRKATGQSGEATDIVSAFNNGHTDTGTIPGQVTALAQASRGWTPFDCPEALSQYSIKIWKKTKYFLSAEQTATYQIRDPKRHVYSKDSTPSSDSANWPGVTKWIYIVFKPIPGYNYVAAPNNDILRLNLGITRKYMYKINQDSTDYDAYV